MKPVRLLLGSIKLSDKAALIFGISAFVPFAAALACLSLVLGVSAPLIPVLAAVLGFVFFRPKLYKLMLSLPVVYHLIDIITAVYLGYCFKSMPEGGTVFRVLAVVSFGYMMFAFAEILTGLLLKVISDGAHPGRFIKAIVSVLPLLFTIIVYIPSETYFNNIKDFIYSYTAIAPYIYIKTIVFSLLAALAMCCLRQKLFRFVSCLSVGLTLCVYCQYMFLNRDLPNALGDPVNWDTLRVKMVINAVIWVVLLALPFVYSFAAGKKFKDNAIAVNGHLIAAGFIGAMQLISLVLIIVMTDGSLFAHGKYMLLGEDQFVVSQNKNVITFIVDAADRHILEEAYEREPEKFEFLKDFTSYDNACMVYDSTFLSIPQMLTGTTKMIDEDAQEWLEEVCRDEPCEEFFSRLHDNGYTVNAFGNFCIKYDPFYEKIDNCRYVETDDMKINKTLVTGKVNALSAYRYFPLALKSVFDPKDLVDDPEKDLFIHNTCIVDNASYLEKLKLEKSEDDKNYFIFDHLNGIHPLAGDPEKNLEICLDLLKEYTDQLKELGLYDDAVIIITADHGTHSEPDDMPIWYMKTAGEHHDEMQHSGAPIYHTDYLATIIEAAGLEKDGDEEIFGRPVFEIGEDEKRERLVFQRNTFEYVGKIDWKKWSDEVHDGAMFGYYFTGGEEELVRHEKNDPPDIVLELDEAY